MDPSQRLRTEQTALYGAPLDEITEQVGRTVGIGPDDMARTIGVSRPMFWQVLSGQRVRIGNPVAINRLRMLREFAQHLASGQASRDDITLTLAQIRATTLAAEVIDPHSDSPSAGSLKALAEESTVHVSPAERARRLSGDSDPHRADPHRPSPPNQPSHPGQPGQPTQQNRPHQQSPTDEPEALTWDTLGHARRLVAAHVARSPARRWPLLERFTGTETWVKHENNNPTGAFKVRGGLTYVARLAHSGTAGNGLIGATRGNHGQSLAYAARTFGIPVTIVVPEGNSPDKNAAMEAYGARLVTHGEDFQAASEHAAELAEAEGLHRVPSFHPWLVEGISTYVAELHESVPHLDVVYVPIGMGSGACAHLWVRDLMGLATRVVGVVAEQAPAYALSFEQGAPVSTPTADTFVDGVACRTPDPTAVRLLNAGLDRVLRVSEDQAREAMGLMYRATHNLAEPAGALALAGLMSDRERVAGQRVAVMHTGANCDFTLLDQVMRAVSD